MRLFIIGANGFIGSHLIRHVLQHEEWSVSAIDLHGDRLRPWMDHPRFSFRLGDFTNHSAFVDQQIAQADVVLPLAAIATPKTYVTDPIRVFELDFEANLSVVRACLRHRSRIVFPSTSEVYGLCSDTMFNEETSALVMGPIHKVRWIYACSKQLLDRIIWSYGSQGLEFTLFRPFNWIGPGQDRITTTNGHARVVTQFLGNILRGEAMRLVDGGRQRRTFTDIEDGISALIYILKQPRIANGHIYNIGFPENEYSIRELAAMMIEELSNVPAFARHAVQAEMRDIPARRHYGQGYQDVDRRVPDIRKMESAFGWRPRIMLRTSLQRIIESYDHLHRSQFAQIGANEKVVGHKSA